MTIKSIERALCILELFTPATPELGVTEIARKLGMHKSTVSRVLSTLEAGRIVMRATSSEKYVLGGKFWSWLGPFNQVWTLGQ